MLLVPTEIRSSPIHGTGVFLRAPVKKGAIVWHFDSRIDRIYTEDEFRSLPEIARTFVDMYGSWNEEARLWLFSGDGARHINHSETPSLISTGGFFSDDVASRDLKASEELTSDYRTICDITAATGAL